MKKREFYEDFYSGYDKRNYIEPSVKNYAADGLIAELAQGKRCVDVACGTAWMEREIPGSVGVDFSMEAVKRAKAKGLANGLVVADAEHLPFKDGAFEFSLCLGSIEHFIHQSECLAEMVRVSKVQIVTAEAKLPLFFEKLKWYLVRRWGSWAVQPVEKTLTFGRFVKMLDWAGSDVILRGVRNTWDIKSVGACRWMPRCITDRLNGFFPDHIIIVSMSRTSN